MELLAERIAKGHALLDEKCPGWEKTINLDCFDMAHSRSCLLGQLYGWFGDGEEAVGLRSLEDSYKHGFYEYPYDPDDCGRDVYARFMLLTDAQRVAIRNRLETGEAAQ
jgi:hypothetical protein